MAVTITLGRLAEEVRVSATDASSDVPTHYVNVLTTNLAAATALVEARAPEAPDDAMNKAVIAVVDYWLESPPAAAQRFGFNAYLQSGAAQMLAPFIQRRAQAI